MSVSRKINVLMINMLTEKFGNVLLAILNVPLVLVKLMMNVTLVE